MSLRFIHGVEYLSTRVGHAFSWSIVVLMAGTCFEVFVRYALNDPTSWAFDFSYLCYGALFFMAGAYALARGSHVRCDIFYRLLPVRRQAAIDLALYFIFYFPGVIALVVFGMEEGVGSARILEVSVNSPAGVPIWPMKLLVPIGAAFLALQGVAEMARCVVCMRENAWPPRIGDVEELELQLIHRHEQEKDAEGAPAPASSGGRP